MVQSIKLSGHRGYKDKATENSKASLIQAIDENLDYIELDIRKTKDNVPIIFHDKKLNRLVNKKKGRVKNYTLEELKTFEYQDGQKILTLSEILPIIKGKIKIILDLKVKGMERNIIKLVRKSNLENDVIIQSKKGLIVNNCYKIDPNLKYALYRGYLGKIGLYGELLKLHKIIAPIIYYVKVKPFPIRYINLDGPFIYEEFLSILHKRRIKIILGSMKVGKYLRYIEKWNIRIINANNPERVKKYLNYYYKNGLVH
ncbi:MAG: hypothetical protein EU535_04865 [Promethearchaeota archaeon]|nr:MAG: hypothetical protein EU535_04865 [Candidatus Lokiarchaeota archaeon]